MSFTYAPAIEKA